MIKNPNGYETVKVGMTVEYRGCFGNGPVTTAKIESIDLCEDEHEKYGESVTEVDPSDLHRCCVSLDDNHWCYGYQIDTIVGFEDDDKK